MSTGKILKSSAFWQTLEVVILLVTQFLYFGVMARLLDKSDYGLMAIANGFVGIGTIFAEGGMGAALIQKKGASEKHSNAALQGGLIFSLIIVAIFYVCAPFIAKGFDQPLLKDLVRVITINFVLLALGAVSISLLHKHFKFKYSALVTIVASTLAYGCGIVLGYMGYGVWSLVAAVLINSLLKMLGYLYFAPVSLKMEWYYSEWKELFSFGSGMILIKVNNYFSKNGLILLLGKIFTPASLGVFERSFQIKNMPSTYLGSILIKVMFPALSKAQDQNQRLFKLYDHGLGLSNSVLMPMALYLIYFAEEVVLIMLGDQWMEAVLPLQIMFLVLPISISVKMTDALIRAKGLVYKNVNRKTIYTVLLLVSGGLGAYYFGLEGAAVAVVLSSVVNYLLMIYLVKVIFKRSFREVFYEPLRYGLILCFKVGVLLLVYHFTIGRSPAAGVWSFLVFSVVFILGLVFTGLRFPSFFGNYVKFTLDRLLKGVRLYRS